MSTRITFLSFLVTSLLASCALERGELGHHTQASGHTGGGTGSESGGNGTILFNENNETSGGFHLFAKLDTASATTSLDTGYFVTAASDIVGVTMELNNLELVEITNAREIDSTGIYEYLVDRTGGTTAEPLCPGGKWAVPVPGKWDLAANALVDHAGEWITYACEGSAAYKCTVYKWNYWDHPEEFHACTRMMRNDVCGTGEPATFDGTEIETYVPNNTGERPFDVYAHSVQPSGQWVSPKPSEPNDIASGDLWLEGGWKAEVDTTHTNYDKYSGHAVCLSKRRWHSLPPGDLCPTTVVLSDPRSEPSASYCDDYTTVGDLEVTLGADIVSESKFTDAMLWAWNATAGGLRTTTQHTDGDTPGFAISGATPTQVGILLTENGYDLLGPEYGTSDFAMLRTYVEPSGKFITTTTDYTTTSGYTTVRDEGYVFVSLADAEDYADLGNMNAVQLWRHQDTSGNWITTLTETGTSVSEGFILTY